MYYPVESFIMPLTTIRRERLLPAPGQVLVQPGEMVGPTDVVARCQIPGKVRILDASRALRVRRDRVEKYVLKSPGDTVQANDVIAAPRGLLSRFRRGLRSPVDGEVLEARDGLILVQETSTTYELTAHLKGQVTNVMPQRGVVVSAVGALIQGTWGNGGEAEGVLKLLVEDRESPIRAESIDVSCHGTIVVGGYVLDEQALEQAVEAKARGIIVGSVNADLRSVIESLPFPLIITEGFGSLPMSEPVFALLHANLGQQAMLGAETMTGWGAKRPEVLIPLRAEDERPAEEGAPRPLQVGDRVRLLRAPYLGTIGQIDVLLEQPQPIESGARVPTARVDLGGGELVLIPQVNLEAIR
jgi:hypothetical protein